MQRAALKGSVNYRTLSLHTSGALRSLRHDLGQGRVAAPAGLRASKKASKVFMPNTNPPIG